MSYAVFPIPVTYPTKHRLTWEQVCNDYGDGYQETIVNSLPWEHADGEGSVSEYPGINEFDLVLDAKPYGSGKGANLAWAFIKAQITANNKPFYIYVFPEAVAIDLTGVATIGRYLVQIVPSGASSSGGGSANAAIERSLDSFQMFNGMTLLVREVRA